MTIHRLRPLSSVFSQGLIACAAFMVPVFIVLYVMSIPDGPWPVVLGTQIIAMAAIGFATWRYFAVAIWVGPDGIAERGFFQPRLDFATSDIGSILLAHTHGPAGTAPVAQLFVRDASGGLLVRLRGQFWSREAMDTIIRTLDVPVEYADEPVSNAELRDSFPSLVYWFERHPIVAALAFIACIAVLGIGLLLIVGATADPS